MITRERIGELRAQFARLGNPQEKSDPALFVAGVCKDFEALLDAAESALKHRDEIWDDATNAVCQAMQEQNMCNCPNGKCLAATITSPKDAA